tara:strand:- start:1254 stop:1535 length:282 start_codon:yes stop_codon:yes gene_type:complete
LSRPDLIKKLKEKNPNFKKSELEVIIDTFNNSLQNALLMGRKVELRGFGTFFIKKIKEKYSARNPKTGKLIYVPQKNKVRFRASKKLRNLLNE